jgi:AcrR family transcriptional regulator
VLINLSIMIGSVERDYTARMSDDPSPAGEGAPAPRADRHARRRAATRARLMDAARTLLAQQGIEATRINEITEQADVGFGSFYNYFDGKDEIVEAVLQQAVAEMGAAIDLVTETLKDPAEVVACAHRFLVEQAVTDPEWGWLLVRLEASHQIGMAALGQYAWRDIERGVEAGRFDVADSAVALVATGGALIGVIRAVLDGRLPATVAADHAAGVLRTLGVAPADAAEVAARPLPAALREQLQRSPGISSAAR